MDQSAVSGPLRECYYCDIARPLGEFKKGFSKTNNVWYHRRCRWCLALWRNQLKAEKRRHAPCAAVPEELRKAFTGFCHICGIDELECDKNLCMDHDHETGVFRGWLCDRCNKTLGWCKDSTDWLGRAKEYLLREN